jgi:amino acid transporter
MAWSGAIPVVTSLSTVALYVAYIIPVILGLRMRGASPRSWVKNAVWNAGRWGMPLNVVAIGYTCLICVILIMPPNELAGKTLAGVMASLAAVYFLIVRRKFRGPEWTQPAALSRMGDFE